VRQAVRDQELQDPALKQPYALWQGLVSALNVLKKLHLFPMMAQEGLVAEEEEESNLNFPSLLTEKLK
jgi:hypothetical protein